MDEAEKSIPRRRRDMTYKGARETAECFMQLKTVCVWLNGKRKQARTRALHVFARELELILTGWGATEHF